MDHSREEWGYVYAIKDMYSEIIVITKGLHEVFKQLQRFFYNYRITPRVNFKSLSLKAYGFHISRNKT